MAALNAQADRLANPPTFGITGTSRLTLGPCDATSRGVANYVALNCDISKALGLHFPN